MVANMLPLILLWLHSEAVANVCLPINVEQFSSLCCNIRHEMMYCNI